MPKQTESILAADLARFIAEKTNHNLFLTGKAGTGKTVFLRDFVKHTKKKVVVLAPTGIAAINANAMTIHSFCRFGLAPCPLGKFSKGNDFLLNDKEEELVKNIDMIIIDEVSMVRADVMDHISEKIRLIRDSKEPFGGVQLLLIGDLYQLPPVVTKEDEGILKDYYGSNYFFYNSMAIRKVGFETVCLNKVYRQDNPEFVNILNKARIGNVSWSDCNKLNTRYEPDFETSGDTNYINLVAQKKQADEINNERLEGVKGDSKTFSSKVSGEFPADLYPTNRQLVLKKGTQIMFVKNDKEGRYCNGTLGEVVAFGQENISVKVCEETIEVTPAKWDNVRYSYDKEKNKIGKISVGTFEQFPIKPAWAITIHKSQGLSFEHAIIDIPHAFAAGQAYVALSRCRSLEGLVLKKKLYPDMFLTDSMITEFYKQIDNVAHINRLASAVGYIAFMWSEENGSQHGDIPRKSNSSAEKLNQEIEDICQMILNNINVYHECGGSITKELVNPTIRSFSTNPYYRMKLQKAIKENCKEMIDDLVSRGLLER